MEEFSSIVAFNPAQNNDLSLPLKRMEVES